jgi:hypothetical protein
VLSHALVQRWKQRSAVLLTMHPKLSTIGCLSKMSVSCLRVCANVSDFLLWSLRRVYLHHLRSSSEQEGTNVSDAHNTRTVTHTRFHLFGAAEWHPSFMEGIGSYARFTNDVYGCQRSDTTATHTNENHSKATQDRQTDRQAETHTHTHTWLAGVQHIGHFLVVSIILESQLLHTHKCAQGKNKCDCKLAHH